MTQERIIEGVVMRTNERQVNTARGPSTSHSALLNTGNGEEWFSFGFKKPALEPNQQVKFVVKQNGNYWNADPDTLEILKTPAAAPSATMAKAVASVDDRQRSIVLQSAYERAINFVRGAIEMGLITLPQKKDAKFDVYMSLVDYHALRLANKFINPPESFDPNADSEETVDVSEAATPAEDYPVV